MTRTSGQAGGEDQAGPRGRRDGGRQTAQPENVPSSPGGRMDYFLRFQMPTAATVSCGVTCR